MFGSVSFWEILLVLLIIALIFGGKKLHGLGKGLGEGIKNFRDPFKKDNKDEKEKKESDNEKDN